MWMHVHRRHLQETVLWGAITWSELGKTYRTYKLKRSSFLHATIIFLWSNKVWSKHVSCIPFPPPPPQLECLYVFNFLFTSSIKWKETSLFGLHLQYLGSWRHKKPDVAPDSLTSSSVLPRRWGKYSLQYPKRNELAFLGQVKLIINPPRKREPWLLE